MSIRFRLYGYLLLALSASLVSAQQTSATPTDLVFKRTVNRVVVDVVVTDSYGKPALGLSAQDFAVKENGSPQRILTFDVHDFQSAYVPPKLPNLPPNTFVNVPSAPERGPLYVLLYDLVNTDMDDQAYARKQLMKFIKDKPEGTRFAIFMLTDGLHLVQGFTSDAQKLNDVVDPSSPKTHIPRIFLYGNNYGRGNVSLMITVFTEIANFLDGLPGRKSLFWFSGKFPMQMAPDKDDPPDLRERITKAINAMVKADVSVYPVDVRGVVVENAHAPAGSTSGGGGGITSDFRSGLGAAPGPGAGAPGGAPAGASSGSTVSSSATPFSNVPHDGGDQGYSLLSSDYMGEDAIAEQTGGHAYYSRNDLRDSLGKATETSGSYYTLTYAPSNETYDGKRRSIQVDLGRSGYHLSYRRSYYAEKPDSENDAKNGSSKSSSDKAAEAAPRKVGDSLFANMEWGAPLSHELYFRAHVQKSGAPALGTPEQMANLAEQPAFFKKRHKDRPAKPLAPIQLQTYVIDYTLATQSKSGNATARLRPPVIEVAAAAFDAEGHMVNGVVDNNTSINTQTPNPHTAAVNPDGIYRAEQEIDIPLNATSLRIAVRDMTSDHIGAMEIPLPLAPEAPTRAMAPETH